MDLPGGISGKNQSANARDIRDLDSIHGLGRFPRGENGNSPGILVWRIPWIEEPGRLQSIGLQIVGYD